MILLIGRLTIAPCVSWYPIIAVSTELSQKISNNLPKFSRDFESTT